MNCEAYKQIPRLKSLLEEQCKSMDIFFTYVSSSMSLLFLTSSILWWILWVFIYLFGEGGMKPTDVLTMTWSGSGNWCYIYKKAWWSSCLCCLVRKGLNENIWEPLLLLRADIFWLRTVLTREELKEAGLDKNVENKACLSLVNGNTDQRDMDEVLHVSDNAGSHREQTMA